MGNRGPYGHTNIGSITCEPVEEELVAEEDSVNIQNVRPVHEEWGPTECTGPDPRKMGEAPDTMILARNSPEGTAYVIGMGPDTGAGVSLIPYEEAVRRKMKIYYSERGLYRLKDASNHLMNVVGTVKLYTVPQGTCESFILRAIVTDSMIGNRGLLGYPDS